MDILVNADEYQAQNTLINRMLEHAEVQKELIKLLRERLEIYESSNERSPISTHLTLIRTKTLLD